MNNTPAVAIGDAINAIRQMYLATSQEIAKELQSAPSGSPEFAWAQLRQRLLQGQAVPEDEMQRTIQAIISSQKPVDSTDPEREAFEKEEQALERILEHRSDNSSFAWYKENERSVWEEIQRHISTHVNESFFQAHPELRRAKNILDLRVRSFTDINAREQLRQITIKEGREAIKMLLHTLEQEQYEVVA